MISAQQHQSGENTVVSDNIVTSKNVDQILDKQKLSLVLFYASWQTECQPKVELIDRLYKKFKQHQQEEEEQDDSTETKKDEKGKNINQEKEDLVEGEDGFDNSNTAITNDGNNKKFMNNLFIGKADVYHDLKLATKFMVEDYCVLKYFVKGSHVAET